MKRMKRRLLLLTSGRLDQPRLEELRNALGLTRRGRLTDSEDSEFGYRNIGDPRDPSMILTLWRDAEDKWSISIDAATDADFDDGQIADWQADAESALRASGLDILERRAFPGEPRPSFEDDWRNENWLRAKHWDLPAQTLAELWAVIGVSPTTSHLEKRAALVEFMKSPTWEPAPSQLRHEAEEFVREADETGGRVR